MARRPQALHQPEDEVLIALYEPPRPGDSGSAFGCKPTPAIQLAGSTSAYKRVPNDMGINAGRIVASTASVEQVGW